MGEVPVRPLVPPPVRHTPPPDICLVNLPRTRHDLSVPLGLLSIAACLERTTRRATILDFDLLHKGGALVCGEDFLEKAVGQAASTGAKIFGITADCANYPLVVQFSTLLKEEVPGAIVVIGGPHASHVARESLEVFPAVDIVVIGEGEDTFPELMEALLLPKPLSGVRGIAYRQDGATCVTEPRPLKDVLDEIPLPAFASYPIRDYLALFPSRGGDPCLPVEAGRGCPKGCYYCSTSVMWRRKFRCKTPARILRELSLLEREHGVTHFEFIHDNLAFDNSFLRSLCAHLTGGSTTYAWVCSASTDRLSRELLHMMARAGCDSIVLGIESGSPRMQRIIGKNLDLERAAAVRTFCGEAGILITAGFMVGFPEETEEDLEQTLETALEWALQGAEVRLSQLAPMPGTIVQRRQAQHLVLKQNSPNGCTAFLEGPNHRELLARHPAIFSSFYTVPNGHDPGIDLSRLVAFFGVMLRHYTQAYNQLLVSDISNGGGPLGIFKKWSEWWDTARPSEPVTRDGVFFTFHEFMDWLAEPCREAPTS